MVKAKELITKEKYGLDREAYDSLSDFAKTQFRKTWKEWVEENCEDFEMFDGWCNQPIENDWDEEMLHDWFDRYKSFNWSKLEEEYWIGDCFDDEDEFNDYLKDMKESFLDSLEDFDYPIVAFQSSDYYNMYLFIEPSNDKFKHGATSIFEANSYIYLGADYCFFSSEAEKALFEISPDCYEEEFVEFGLKVLQDYPNANMDAIAAWIVENDLGCWIDEIQISEGQLSVETYSGILTKKLVA